MESIKRLRKWAENMNHGVELMPCPFCGEQVWARRVTYPNGDSAYMVMPHVVTGGCYVCSNIPNIEDYDWSEFVKAWNRRAK